MKVVTNQLGGASLRAVLGAVGIAALRFRAAVPFFTVGHLVKQVAQVSGNHVHLIVTLCPPTDYFALREIYSMPNVEVEFVDGELHSKLYLLQTANSQLAVIGSSNLTNGGLASNIETNVVFEGQEIEFHSLEKHFQFIAQHAQPLTPEVLDGYRLKYEEYLKSRPKTPTPSTSTPPKLKTSEARSFIRFWKTVDRVRDIVGDLAASRFPNLPAYVALDHFWHFVVAVRNDEVRDMIRRRPQDDGIRRLFEEYADWDLREVQFHKVLADRLAFFKSTLQRPNILTLSEEKISEVYFSLHSTEMLATRFHFDKKFLAENTPTEIVRTLDDLLHGEDRIEFRIDRALTANKLKFFGASAVQELNGWFRPEVLPIRNAKADAALELLLVH